MQMKLMYVFFKSIFSLHMLLIIREAWTQSVKEQRNHIIERRMTVVHTWNICGKEIADIRKCELQGRSYSMYTDQIGMVPALW